MGWSGPLGRDIVLVVEIAVLVEGKEEGDCYGEGPFFLGRRGGEAEAR